MAYTPPENIQTLLKKLPTTPGVYLHKDKYGKIIYVGKAIIMALYIFLTWTNQR